MIQIEINEAYQGQFNPQLLEIAAQAALAQQGAVTDADLTLVITGDEQLHELNLRYLEVDAPTDVLSFPAGHEDPDTGRQYLGDILISFPRASQQADAARHSTESEMTLLTVHGVLHLLGHDHAEPLEKARMWAAQSEILRGLGVNVQIPGDENSPA